MQEQTHRQVSQQGGDKASRVHYNTVETGDASVYTLSGLSIDIKKNEVSGQAASVLSFFLTMASIQKTGSFRL